MNKYCKFLQDVKDDNELIWEKDKEYLIIYENKENYYFGEPITNGIDKKIEGTLFIVINDTEYIESEDKRN